ncbi:MAG: DNA repair exonuclease [Nitrososphaerota archaeon]|nr:DNA repair exonuclease [Nitrososphaerota archaeon]
MPRFAHMSDLHIGAFRQEELREPLLRAFESSMDICMERNVDFVIMAGDVFDSNIPDLGAVTRATRKMREARARGIRFYVVYGSHDFSPNRSSMIDVLESAGVFVKVERLSEEGGRARLRFVTDETGAKICGISGRKLALDRKTYGELDAADLEGEKGFKIFVFHGAIEELKPEGLERMDAMPAAHLPKGFDYYAGGHVHFRSVNSLEGRENIVYPGPLFGGDLRDLEAAARGLQRGFYMVDFDEKVTDVSFVPVKTCEVVELEYSAQGSDPSEVNAGLRRLAGDVAGKVVILKVFGELAAGKTSEVDFAAARKGLLDAGAAFVLVSSARLSARESEPLESRSPSETEEETFRGAMARVRASSARLKGDEGLAVSMSLLRALREGRKANETKADYEARMLGAGRAILGLDVP